MALSCAASLRPCAPIYFPIALSSSSTRRASSRFAITAARRPTKAWTISRLTCAACGDFSTLESIRQPCSVKEESIHRGRIEERVSRAAVALFCKGEEPLSDFPQLLLMVARFKGVTRDEFHDNRQFHGNAFALMRRAERFLIESLPIAGRIIPRRSSASTSRGPGIR